MENTVMTFEKMMMVSICISYTTGKKLFTSSFQICPSEESHIIVISVNFVRQDETIEFRTT